MTSGVITGVTANRFDTFTTGGAGWLLPHRKQVTAGVAIPATSGLTLQSSSINILIRNEFLTSRFGVLIILINEVHGT